MNDERKVDGAGNPVVDAVPVHTHSLQAVPAPEDEGLDLVRLGALERFQAAKMEAQQRLADKIVRAAVTFTKPSQGFDYEGKPYPSIDAAETIAARSGVSVRRISKEKLVEKDEKGVYFSWSVTVEVSAPDPFDKDVRQSFEFTGICSTREITEKDRNTGAPLPNAVIEHKVLSKAHSRAVRNGILRFLGLRGLGWPELAAIGVTPAVLKGLGRTIQHGRKQPPPEAGPPPAAPQAPAQGGAVASAPAAPATAPQQGAPLISKAQANRLWAIAAGRAEMVGVSTETICRDVLGARGFDHTEKVPKDQYDAIVAECERWEPKVPS